MKGSRGPTGNSWKTEDQWDWDQDWENQSSRGMRVGVSRDDYGALCFGPNHWRKAGRMFLLQRLAGEHWHIVIAFESNNQCRNNSSRSEPPTGRRLHPSVLDPHLLAWPTFFMCPLLFPCHSAMSGQSLYPSLLKCLFSAYFGCRLYQFPCMQICVHACYLQCMYTNACSSLIQQLYVVFLFEGFWCF